MKPLSIRASLTAWLIGFTAMLLAAFSTTLYRTVDTTLRMNLDGRLRVKAESLAELCEWDTDHDRPEVDVFPHHAKRLAADVPGRGIDIWTWPERHPMIHAGESAGVAFPEDGDLTNERPCVRYNTSAGTEPRRTCILLTTRPAIPAMDGDPPEPAFDVCIRVSDSLTPLEAQLARVGWVAAGLAGISILVVIGFSFLLSRKIVKPLRELGRGAVAVKCGVKSDRLARGTGDEIDTLARLLDETFESLQGVLDRQARFTADAAHELRNPIAIIRAAAEVALRNDRAPEEYRNFLRDVLSTAHRMGEIVEALLLLARLDANALGQSLTPQDLREAVMSAIAERPEGRGRVRFEDGAPAVVPGDERLLRILAGNLLTNALQYSPPGSTVEVSVRADERQVNLSVANLGPPVRESDRPHLFERFYRVDAANPNSNGAGLGLSIVSAIARAHAATCTLESGADGTRVSIVFDRNGMAEG